MVSHHLSKPGPSSLPPWSLQPPRCLLLSLPSTECGMHAWSTSAEGSQNASGQKPCSHTTCRHTSSHLEGGREGEKPPPTASILSRGDMRRRRCVLLGGGPRSAGWLLTATRWPWKQASRSTTPKRTGHPVDLPPHQNSPGPSSPIRPAAQRKGHGAECTLTLPTHLACKRHLSPVTPHLSFAPKGAPALTETPYPLSFFFPPL